MKKKNQSYIPEDYWKEKDETIKSNLFHVKIEIKFTQKKKTHFSTCEPNKYRTRQNQRREKQGEKPRRYLKRRRNVVPHVKRKRGVWK